MACRRKDRLASELTVQDFASMLLYDEVKAGIVWVLKAHPSVKKDKLAGLVAKEYFRVLYLGGSAKKALDQAVSTCAGTLARSGITYRKETDSYSYWRGA